MSQKKVDVYKQNKANRSQIIKKEKRMIFLEKLIAGVVVVACVCWIGYSAYTKTQTKAVEETVAVQTEIDTSALDAYLDTLTDAE